MAKTDSTWRRSLWRGGLVVGVVVVLLSVTAVWLVASTVLRVPSPDGRLVAECEAIPVFDGPDYAMRLERPDGTLVTRLTDWRRRPRVEAIRAHDSSTIAVLTEHVARIRFVDVSWALAHPRVAAT